MKASRLLAFLVISLFGVTVSSTADEGKPLRLEMHSDATGLRIILRNASTFHVKADCRFAIGSDGDPVEIRLRVLDQDRNVHVYQLKSKIGLPRPSDWCDLPPNQLVGVYVPVSEVQYAYELRPGIYTVQAFYIFRDRDGRELDAIGSNAVQIRI